jgi:uncharacterized protein YrzB (UPF0473 family)
MTNEPEVQEQADVITLEGDDGQSYSCQVLHTFDFEDKKYALVLNLGEASFAPESEHDEPEEGSIVILRVSQRGDQAIFQTIETQEEFDRVVAHVEEMAAEEDDEDDEDEQKEEA